MKSYRVPLINFIIDNITIVMKLDKYLPWAIVTNMIISAPIIESGKRFTIVNTTSNVFGVMPYYLQCVMRTELGL